MGIQLNGARWAIMSVLVAGLVFLAERIIEPGSGGTLTIVMTLFLGFAEGAMCLMAGAELSDGHWHKPLLSRAASLMYMIPVCGLLFLVNIPQISVYPWVDLPGWWLQRGFFIVRHLVMFVLVFAVARRFLTLAMRNEGRARFWAVIYVIMFVSHLTMIGIEWFMSIERPWFSTLFGGFFVVSAFLTGICTLALAVYPWRTRDDAALKLVQKSLGGLMFGFSIFWAYFYFSQLIVIWYGNIPEETSYLARRIGYHTPYWFIARLIFTLVWVVPFATLLRRKNKTIAGVTSFLALVIMTGITMQYWLMLQPVWPVNVPLLLIEAALMAFLMASVVRSHEALLGSPDPVKGQGALAAAGH